MKHYLALLLFCTITCFVVSCHSNSTVAAADDHFVDTSTMDRNVKPGDNFFQFVNGKWLKNTTIPASESSAGAGLDLYNRTKKTLHRIVDSLSKGKFEKGSSEQKVGDFYAAAMDSVAVEKRGYDPLQPLLTKIAAINNPQGIMQYVEEQQRENTNPLFSVTIGADQKNSNYNIATFAQGGLGLPDRDYYFNLDPSTQKVVAAYRKYVRQLFVLTGDDSVSAGKKETLLFELEKKMAAVHRTQVELRDPQSNYNKKLVTSLQQEMPVIGWKAMLDAIGIHADSVDVAQPAFFTKLNGLLTTVPVDQWKIWLKFHTIDEYAYNLSSAFVNAKFAYRGTALNGQAEMKPRWERMVAQTDNFLGDALGQVYVKKYFTDDAKKRMLELVNNLQAAFANRIDKLDWMSDSTRKKAKDKLHSFIKKIGYPDKWRDYSKVDISPATFFENRLACERNEYNYQVAKVGKQVDKTEWGMSPPTINAYYNPTFNEIVFPAGILQFPFFDIEADDAVNYGGIGMVIGHEMTHGFDDDGAQYDKDGNLKNWWSREDSILFHAKTLQVAHLYDGFTVLDTVHVNGKLTNGENIADVGGVNIAYDAFKMTAQGKDTVRINGFTPDQRFFISIAQISKDKQKEAYSRMLINLDPHSPSMYRVNGPLMNSEAFYKAFDVKPGDKMYLPENERLKIW